MTAARQQSARDRRWPNHPAIVTVRHFRSRDTLLPVATLDDLIACIDDPEDDSTRAYQIVDELVASGDQALIPLLKAQLDSYLDEEHFYGRDVIADVLAGLAGINALPLLVRAAARDLGDDQDTLHATITDLIHVTPADAGPVIDTLFADPDAAVRKVAASVPGYWNELQTERAFPQNL